MAASMRVAVLIALAFGRVAGSLVADVSSVAAPSGADATADAIAALDTDRSGKVEKAEVEAFARSQGLSADEVRAEFRSLDTNGNGELEANEISRTLYDDSQASIAVAQAAPVLPRATPAQVAPATPAVAAAPAATVVQRSSSAELQVQSLEQEAQRHAGKALAEIFARTAAKALETRSQDAQKANKLEEAAKSLRGQTAEIRRTAATLTVQAAKDAAAAVMREAQGQIKELEEQADEAEKQAAMKRGEARDAMQKAMTAQASMASSLQQLKQQDVM